MSAEAKTLAVLFLLTIFPFLALAEERWKIQFFYDRADSVLDVHDFKCSSASHCLAAGIIEDKRGRERGAVVVTTNGGQDWALLDVAEHPISLFLLNDSLGWMVTDHAVWTTDQGGKTWKKLSSPKGALSVHFLSPQHGFAIGDSRALFETNDGGKTWTKFPSTSRPAGEKESTIYDCIAFSGEHGAIVGRLEQQEQEPVWMHAASARRQGSANSVVALLETTDGGKTWKPSTRPMHGIFTDLAMSRTGDVVGLVEYTDMFRVPSSVFQVKLGDSGPETIFERKDRAVTSIALLSEGGAFLASIEPPGNSNQVPIPGKLRMLRSSDLKTWVDMDSDYRATAQRAIVAAPDALHAWVATDTGMILTLTGATSAAK